MVSALTARTVPLFPMSTSRRIGVRSVNAALADVGTVVLGSSLDDGEIRELRAR